DVERATRDVHVLALLHHGGETIGELHAAALDANEHEAVGAIIELDDLVCHAAERAIHGPRIEHGGGGRGHGGEIYATGAGRGEGVVPQAGGSGAGSERRAAVTRAANVSSQRGTSPVLGWRSTMTSGGR